MKKKFKVSSSILICLLMAISVFCQENKYQLYGTVDSRFDEQSIMLFRFKNDTIFEVDTVIVKNGAFYFEGKEYLEDVSILSVGNYPGTVIAHNVILEKGVIELSVDEKRIKGTPLNELYQVYLDTTRSYAERIKELYEELDNGGFVVYDSPLHELYKEEGRYTVNFKKNNIHNVVGRYFFETELDVRSGESFAYGNDSAFVIVYNAADEAYRNSSRMQELIKERESYKKTREEFMKKQQGSVGTSFPDFELMTPDGESYKISDYVGKSDYLLIDFWASWCSPCIVQMPFLKKLYEEYHSKGLDIVGISMDTSLKRWTQGIDKIDVPWPHISDLLGTGSELAEAYHIRGIPYAVLINKDGIIVKTGSPEVWQEELKELLDKD